MKELLFGAAYYDEYMPYDRLDQDVALMKKAGINTVRIAESTWSTCEPQEGVFDFSHVERVMDAMEEAFGVAPVNKGEGGSIPFIPELQRIFPDAQVLVTGPEDPKANAHSPNESISLPSLKNNVITEALLLDKLAK